VIQTSHATWTCICTRQEGKTKADRERGNYQEYQVAKLYQKNKLFEIIFLGKLVLNYYYCGTKAHFSVTFMYQ